MGSYSRIQNRLPKPSIPVQVGVGSPASNKTYYSSSHFKTSHFSRKLFFFPDRTRELLGNSIKLNQLYESHSILTQVLKKWLSKFWKRPKRPLTSFELEVLASKRAHTLGAQNLATGIFGKETKVI